MKKYSHNEYTKKGLQVQAESFFEVSVPPTFYTQEFPRYRVVRNVNLNKSTSILAHEKNLKEHVDSERFPKGIDVKNILCL